jgi:hypothetical protein
MGMITESNILNQLKKAQGETNDRLERLIAEHERTNQLLEWLGQVLQASTLERLNAKGPAEP